MYKLKVPLVAQQKDSTCWNAAAQMLWLYYQGVTGYQGPMNTLGDEWNTNQAINPNEFVSLAKKAGLKPLPKSTKKHTEESLKKLLKTHGPIWCAGGWYGFKHIIVLTGVSKNIVYLNDPDKGIAKVGTIDWFNIKLDSYLETCMMVSNF